MSSNSHMTARPVFVVMRSNKEASFCEIACAPPDRNIPIAAVATKPAKMINAIAGRLAPSTGVSQTKETPAIVSNVTMAAHAPVDFTLLCVARAARGRAISGNKTPAASQLRISPVSSVMGFFKDPDICGERRNTPHLKHRSTPSSAPGIV